MRLEYCGLESGFIRIGQVALSVENNHLLQLGFPSGSAEKNLPVMQEDAGDVVSVPGLGRSPEGGHGNPLHYSCLENPMDRGAWWATVHRVAKSWIQLKQPSTHTLISYKWHLKIK